MAGIAFVNGSNLSLSPSDVGTRQSIATLTVDLPSAGFVLLQATGTSKIGTTSQTSGAVARGDISVGSGTTGVCGAVPFEVVGFDLAMFAVSCVTPVSAGQQTFNVSAELSFHNQPGFDWHIDVTSFQVIFIQSSI